MYRNKLVVFVFLCFLYFSGYSQAYYVSTLAGDTTSINANPYLNSNAGYKDGAHNTALFNGPTGIAVDTSGNVYVADTYNNLIRKINALTGMVTTLAGDTADIKKGLDSNIGYLNSVNAFTAKFSNPLGVCVDKYGNVYVADTYNNVIRKISSSGTVTTYAGKDSAGMTFGGYVNGPDSIAEFFFPTSLAIDTAGNIYVADNGNNAIREIWASTGLVTTLAGSPNYADYINGPIDTAKFYSLYGIALENSGAVLATQFATGYNAVRRLYHDTVTTYAGWDTGAFGSIMGTVPVGYRNGKDTLGNDTGIVLFNGPTGITFDTAGNLLIADEFNNVIRLFNAKDSIVTTSAGNYANDSIPFHDGWDTLALFYNPMGVAADKAGNVYVADLGNNLIRKISLQPPLGISQIKKPAYTLTVYPNPCTDRLNIVSSFTGKADLLDVTGRVIWTDNNFKSPYSLSTSVIFPGIYFLRVTSASATEIRKIEIVK